MKKLFLLGLLFSSYFTLFSQIENFTLDLDSSHVENNAVAYYENGGIPQYVFMPTLHSGNVNNGDVFFITADIYSFSFLSSYKIPQLRGAVINSIEITATNEIVFAGTQNNCGIIGALNAAGYLNWIKKDTTLRQIAAMNLLELGTNKDMFLACSSTLPFLTGKHRISQNMTTLQRLSTTDIVTTDVTIQNTSISSTSVGIILGKKSHNSFVLIPQKVSGGLFIQNCYAQYTLPTNVTWASDNGSITTISAGRHIAAIPIRNLILQKDGVLLVKFSFSPTQGFSLISNKVLYFPSQKVFVNDIVYINEPYAGDVSINVLGQYITSYAGQPFIAKIDTNLTTFEALAYATFAPDHLYRNFQLKKGFYNAENSTFVTTGSYQSYGTVYPKAGLYVANNPVGVFWAIDPSCETPIELQPTTLTLSNTTFSRPTLSSNMLTTVVPQRQVRATFNDFNPDCTGKKQDYHVPHKVSKSPFKESNITMTNNNQQLLFNNLPADCQYAIINTLGQELNKDRIVSTSISISDLYSGVYIIKIVRDNRVIFTTKFVKL